MSNHSWTNSHNHRTTDASTTNHHAAPSGIFVIDTERILVTIAPYGWRTYIRREQPNEYAVCYENAAGVISDSLALDRREARRLVAEKCRAAVWIDLQDQTEWLDDNRAVNGGTR